MEVKQSIYRFQQEIDNESDVPVDSTTEEALSYVPDCFWPKTKKAEESIEKQSKWSTAAAPRLFGVVPSPQRAHLHAFF